MISRSIDERTVGAPYVLNDKYMRLLGLHISIYEKYELSTVVLC